MTAEVKKVQELLDLPSDNENRYSGFEDVSTLPVNNESIQQNLTKIKSEKELIFNL